MDTGSDDASSPASSPESFQLMKRVLQRWVRRGDRRITEQDAKSMTDRLYHPELHLAEEGKATRYFAMQCREMPVVPGAWMALDPDARETMWREAFPALRSEYLQDLDAYKQERARAALWWWKR